MRENGVQEVEGSNPFAPTTLLSTKWPLSTIPDGPLACPVYG
jgi:hypothetical protein